MKDPWEGFTCDKCGKPIIMDQAVYSIATNTETKKARHWSCHTPMEEHLAHLKDAVHTAERVGSMIRREIDRRKR